MFIFTVGAFAAPLPGTSLVKLDEKPGYYYSPEGFHLHAAKTSWQQIAPPKHIPSLVTIYKSPLPSKRQQAALTVRVDKLKTKQSVRTYVKRWMQDYARFGFDVLTAKPVQVNKTNAFLLDIISKETQKKLRQVVFLKDKTAVILTCRDDREQFAKTVEDCNEIIRTFEWTEATP